MVTGMGKQGLLVAIVLATLAASAALAQDTEAPVFHLAEGSEVRFLIDEGFMRRDITVVGATPLVTGTVQFDRDDPVTASVSTITIDASDLDSGRRRRDQAIVRRILNADQDRYRYITFEPTAITGMPPLVQVGDILELQITGIFRVRNSVNEEVFDTTVTVVSETELQGLASTTIRWRAYGLRIPSVAVVSWVADEVTLELAFTAVLPD